MDTFSTKGKRRELLTGFTLIELLVVISIISLLSIVVFASVNSARVKARDATRIAEVRQLVTALQLYYNDNNSFPATSGAQNEENGDSHDYFTIFVF